METANVLVRLGGDLGNAVPKIGVTPAEILVLKHIHGSDAVVDVRPAGFDKRRRHEEEYNRLAATYDRGAGEFVSRPGEEREGVMAKLFPGAMRRLPVTLADIGYDIGPVDGAAQPSATPNEPSGAQDAEGETDADEADATEAAAGEATATDETAE